MWSSVQAERLAADSIQVWQLGQLVIGNISAVSLTRVDDLLAQFVLNICVLGKEVYNARHCVGRSVDSGEYERAKTSINQSTVKGRLPTMPDSYSRHLGEQLFVRESVFFVGAHVLLH